MRQAYSAALALAAMLGPAILMALPSRAQTTTNVGSQPPPLPTPPPPGHAVGVPGYPYPVYVLPVQPKDDRTPRQRCLDDEAARIGGTLSDLDRRTIDLKCSQR